MEEKTPQQRIDELTEWLENNEIDNPAICGQICRTTKIGGAL